MSTILNIETATQVCSVGLAIDGKIAAIRESSEKNIHASRTTIFIGDVLKEAGIAYRDLSAVAVSEGPGSYTGLRIGTSVAKGLCYSLDIPLIAVSTLEAMALGAAEQMTGGGDDLFCPMIDARRMEVYCALYKKDNEKVREVSAEIVDENFLSDISAGRKVWFFGDGAQKCREVLAGRTELQFLDSVKPSAHYMAPISHRAYLENEFADTAYFEPFYLKEFIPGKPKIKGLE
jgi:tRNA threonylcarbamoyladenosine biosynthesis protein TsaB